MLKKEPIIRLKNQNKVFLVGFFLILAVIAWSLARPFFLQDPEKENEELKINEEILRAPVISLEEFSAKIKNSEKVSIFDLREAGEFSKGHLAGAMNFPSGAGLTERIAELGIEKTANLFVMNEGNNVFETAAAANALISAGYINTKYLRGGVSDLRAGGYTLVSDGKSPGDQSKIKKITVEKIAAELSSGDELIQFLDVRSQAMFDSGHIPKAMNLPLSLIEKDQKGISPGKKVIVYGGTEEEASRAAVILFDLNFFNIFVLDGGLEAWKKADGKFE